MQKLGGRDTYTPTDIPQVRGNCGILALNSPEGRDSVPCLKTPLNNLDAALTASEQAGQNLRVSAVYVLNQRGQPLMPCSPRTARVLLKTEKARVVKRTPFTIQLTYSTGETKQEITLGVDPGYKYVGLSAVSETKELYAAQVELRTDIVKLNAERAAYRRNRRNRKTWYRKPRFLNRKNRLGKLPPSVQNKLDAHVKVVKQVVGILPISQIVLEVAAFDIQKINNPEIEGKGYQQGVQSDFWNVREYVLYRDGHKCQHCKGKSKDKILNVHHIESRQTGGDRPDNLITLCKTCHNAHHQGTIELKTRKAKAFKAETFMSMIRWRLWEDLKTLGIPIQQTFGYKTKSSRIAFRLEKSHVKDAFVIAGGKSGNRLEQGYLIKQVRKCNRKLFKGARSHIRNTAPRFVHGFQRYDKVLWEGIECFIFGRRQTGAFEIRNLNGVKLHSNAKVKQMGILETSKSLLIAIRSRDCNAQ